MNAISAFFITLWSFILRKPMVQVNLSLPIPATSAGPLHFKATAQSATHKAITGWEIYANNKLKYKNSTPDLDSGLIYFDPGTYSIEVKAWDADGNHGSKTLACTITKPAPPPPPVPTLALNLISPADGSKIDNNVHFVANAKSTDSDIVSWSVIVNNELVYFRKTNAANLDIQGLLPPGPAAITVKVANDAGETAEQNINVELSLQ